MPKQQETYNLVARLFDAAEFPSGSPTLPEAWLGIYQVLWWYEENSYLKREFLHVKDANNLRPTQNEERQIAAGRLTPPTTLNEWQRVANAVEVYIANQLGNPVTGVRPLIGLLWNIPPYDFQQKQNNIGAGFVGLLLHVLCTFGNPALHYTTEISAHTSFPGFVMTGRSKASKGDILVSKAGVPRALISAKWSLRHDRNHDVITECRAYKTAANSRGIPFNFFVVTNEYDPGRLIEPLEDACIDGLVHVSKECVTTVAGRNGRLGDLLDLVDLVNLTHTF